MPGIWIQVRSVQFAKAAQPMLSRLPGSLISFRAVQPRKASSPMESSLSGKVSFSRLTQLTKARLPILVTPSPITSSLMDSRFSSQGAGRPSRKSNISPVPVMVSVPTEDNSQFKETPQMPEPGKSSAVVATVGAAHFSSSALISASRTSSGRVFRNWSRMSPASISIRRSNSA